MQKLRWRHPRIDPLNWVLYGALRWHLWMVVIIYAMQIYCIEPVTAESRPDVIFTTEESSGIREIVSMTAIPNNYVYNGAFIGHHQLGNKLTIDTRKYNLPPYGLLSALFSNQLSTVLIGRGISNRIVEDINDSDDGFLADTSCRLTASKGYSRGYIMIPDIRKDKATRDERYITSEYMLSLSKPAPILSIDGLPVEMAEPVPLAAGQQSRIVSAITVQMNIMCTTRAIISMTIGDMDTDIPEPLNLPQIVCHSGMNEIRVVLTSLDLFISAGHRLGVRIECDKRADINNNPSPIIEYISTAVENESSLHCTVKPLLGVEAKNPFIISASVDHNIDKYYSDNESYYWRMEVIDIDNNVIWKSTGQSTFSKQIRTSCRLDNAGPYALKLYVSEGNLDSTTPFDIAFDGAAFTVYGNSHLWYHSRKEIKLTKLSFSEDYQSAGACSERKLCKLKLKFTQHNAKPVYTNIRVGTSMPNGRILQVLQESSGYIDDGQYVGDIPLDFTIGSDRLAIEVCFNEPTVIESNTIDAIAIWMPIGGYADHESRGQGILGQLDAVKISWFIALCQLLASLALAEIARWTINRLRKESSQ